MSAPAPTPHAVIIPFGVPEEGRGLGLGLAALVHGFAQVGGHSVALAQLFGRREGDPDSAAPGPVESFVPPHAWRDLAGSGNAPADVTLVITGSFEPPGEGRGSITLLAFDAQDGSTRAKSEAHVDDAHAGRSIVAALDELWSRVGGALGIVRDIGDLEWDALESVLRAERCALHDPTRGGPHDRLAAMLHLGRAVEEAPTSKYPAGRLAAFALETTIGSPHDAKLVDAAMRALARASEDAPGQLDLLEATAALQVRLGKTLEAEAAALVALAQAPNRARLYALLSEARRARGDLEGARNAIEQGLARAPGDTTLLTERGIVLAAAGDSIAARSAWSDVLAREPGHVAAYANYAALLVKEADAAGAQPLIDLALAARGAHPEILRRAIQLALATEPDGVARASRVATLARALLERAPDDAWGSMILARSLVQMGDKPGAAAQLARVESIAPKSALAAEAQRGRFSIQEPMATLELDAVLRSAYSAPLEDLASIAARGRRVLASHPVWPAWFAVGVAERRAQRWLPAREAFDAALTLAEGCSPAHRELVTVCVALGDAEAALTHAQRAITLEGESPRSLGALATALFAAGRKAEADETIGRAIALDEADAENRALADKIRGASLPPSTPIRRIYDALDRWRKR